MVVVIVMGRGHGGSDGGRVINVFALHRHGGGGAAERRGEVDRRWEMPLLGVR